MAMSGCAGEISGFRGPHSSGHCYFALKDDSAKIEAVIWKTAHARMRFKPQEGLEVIATGRLTTYPGSSKYQIVIEALEPAGVGALMALMEERKRKLSAEGLFDEARKQLLPWLPEVIGVVTSPTGAVIRDILHRLQDRFPRRVLVWPVRVQGEGSAEQIAAAIRGFNALPEGGRIPRPDLLIVARGGGSLEDLWSFNEEIVVRAAADSMIPLISAVGHETDITLIDFACRQARADADGRRRNGGAGAQRIVRRGRGLGAAHDAVLAARPGRPPQRVSRRRPRAARRRANCSRSRGSGSIGATACLPRGLRANTHAHFRRFAQTSARLTLRVLRGQVAQADHRLTVCGERMTHSRAIAAATPQGSLCRAGDQAEGLKTLQRAGAAPDASPATRTHAAAGRARAARAAWRCSGSRRGSPIAASCWRRCRIAAC
jgi:exodeoxyribonuclease VII large subunit